MDKYTKECDRDEIQGLWKPALRDKVFYIRAKDGNAAGVGRGEGCITGLWSSGWEMNFRTGESIPSGKVTFTISFGGGQSESAEKKELVWLPSLSQIIELIGDDFGEVARGEDRSGNGFFIGYLQARNGDGELCGCIGRFEGATPEIACIKALKQVLNNDKTKKE